MADDDLQAIRARRMAEMRSSSGSGGGSGGLPAGLPAGLTAAAPGGGQNAQEEAEKRSQQEEMKRTMARLQDLINESSLSDAGAASWILRLANDVRKLWRYVVPASPHLGFLFSGCLVVARIKIVKEEKARAVEDLLIRMAQSGQIRSKVVEPTLIGLLEQINEANQKETKIVYNRRRDSDSEDEDWGL
ncbi:hypothetical protein HKX48_005944 [Thoreauomyces humboldtii]|nr:hypothetical protein HKX48_005944 [Thoreauomyces humboldtii]